MAKIRRLKPAGHSAVIEALIQPAIVIGSTLMSAIAAYVLAGDEIRQLLSGHGSWFAGFIVLLSVGIGFLIDMAIIVSATRYKMHTLRGPVDANWRKLSQMVLTFALSSEALTLLYFFYEQAPLSFPSWVATPLTWVHSSLVLFRAFLPPTILAYFVAGVMPIVVERSDRNREVKSRTSQNIAVLIERLTQVADTQETGEMLAALGSLLALNAYASNDSFDQLSEDEQGQRDTALLEKIADLHGLTWHQGRTDQAVRPLNPLHAPSEEQAVEELPVLPLGNGLVPSLS